MRADIDEVEGVELDSTVEVAWSDHVDLVSGSWLRIDPRWVGNTFGDVAGLAAPRSGESFGVDDPFDGPSWRDRVDTHPSQLPGDSQRPVLASRIGNKAGTRRDDRLPDIIGGTHR